MFLFTFKKLHMLLYLNVLSNAVYLMSINQF